MAAFIGNNPFFLTLLFSLSAVSFVTASEPTIRAHDDVSVTAYEKQLILLALNLEYLECEFFLWSTLGYGLDKIAPSYAKAGPPPIGARKANLDEFVNSTILEFAYQEIGHIRAIYQTVGRFPRPLMDLSPHNFANIFDEAVGYKLEPPFDPYANSINYLLAAYYIPYVGLNGYVGTTPNLTRTDYKRLVAGLLAVEGGQDAVVRALLSERRFKVVEPYNKTVAYFTAAISKLRNNLGQNGIKDEGIWVPKWLGAENRTHSNVLSADPNSLGYARMPPEILSIMYTTGNESRPGGFFPKGANGKIARSYLLTNK